MNIANIYVVGLANGKFQGTDTVVDNVEQAAEYTTKQQAEKAASTLGDGSLVRKFIKTTFYCEVNEV